MHPLRWRKATWAIIAWIVIGAAFFVVQLLRLGAADQCATDAGLQFFCRFRVVSNAFNGMLTVATVLCLGAVVLGVIWFYTIPENPPCPECGHRNRTDYGVCRWCGHIFLRPPTAQP